MVFGVLAMVKTAMGLLAMTRMAQSRQRWLRTDTLDDLFLTHYSRLVARAQQLVGRNRQAAEDLVHDAYVRLALRQFDASPVENVEAYLFMTLRNVHLSQVRRRQANVSATASIIDHESALAGLRSFATDEERRGAYDALRQVVRYACLRKTTSTAASVLILRFFHGYYPAEIARVVLTTEAAVAERLRMARAEARAYLADPSGLRSFDVGRNTPSLDSRVLSIADLQRTIFEAYTGVCLANRALDQLYAAGQSAPLDVDTLAHLVSCAPCLDTVNRRLGLPLLADRDPSDRLGRGGGGSGAGGGRATDLATSLRGRVTDTREEHPQELRIAVNGLFVSSLAVNGSTIDQRLKILVAEAVGFIEIFDERDTCLLYLDIDPPPHGAVEQSARVPMSGGRELSATVAFADATPALHVDYDAQPLSTVVDRSTAGERVPTAPDAAAAQAQVRTWNLWPMRLRFVLAGIILGALLANPRQTLAAVDHVRRVIVESIGQIIDKVRARPTLPAHPVSRLIDATTPAVTAVDVSRAAAFALPATAAREEASDLDLSELTLEAFRALDGVDSLTKEQVGVVRGPDRRLRIQGIVDSDTRRRELLAALRALPASRVRVELMTLEEASRQAQAQTTPVMPTPVRSADVTRDREPAGFEQVRRYVHASGMKADIDIEIDEQVRRFSAGLLDHALQARLHARTVQDLIASVSPAQVDELSPASRATWWALVRRHATFVRDETASLRATLDQLFPQPMFAADEPSQDDVWEMSRRLFTLTSSHDVDVRRAFTVETDGSASLHVSTPAFRRSLLDAERLADSLLAAMPPGSHP